MGTRIRSKLEVWQWGLMHFSILCLYMEAMHLHYFTPTYYVNGRGQVWHPLPNLLKTALWVYSGTPLNGHPSTVDVCNITDISECLDRISIDINILLKPLNSIRFIRIITVCALCLPVIWYFNKNPLQQLLGAPVELFGTNEINNQVICVTVSLYHQPEAA